MQVFFVGQTINAANCYHQINTDVQQRISQFLGGDPGDFNITYEVEVEEYVSNIRDDDGTVLKPLYYTWRVTANITHRGS